MALRRLISTAICRQQQRVHTMGVKTPKTKRAAGTASPAEAHSEEVTSARGKEMVSSIPAADNLNKINAIPADPRGNMEKSLCMLDEIKHLSRVGQTRKEVRRTHPFEGG